MMTGSYSRMRTSLKTALNVPNVQSYDAHLLVVHIIFFVKLFSNLHAALWISLCYLIVIPMHIY